MIAAGAGAGADTLQAMAASLGLNPTSAQSAALENYLGLLRRWNATYNLTSVRDPALMRTHHLADCMATIPPLLRHLGPTPARVLDVGSGGGLPGAIIAILNPQVDVTCVDAVGKKAAFVRQVAAELALPNLHALHARVESVDGVFDVVTARAFATLADLVRLTRERLRVGGVWMAMKGRPPTDEIRAVQADIDVFHVEPLHVPGLAAERCLVWMRVAG